MIRFHIARCSLYVLENYSNFLPGYALFGLNSAAVPLAAEFNQLYHLWF